MPPIKGRMMGRMGVITSVQQSTKQIRHVQKTTIARRKFKGSPIKASTLPENITEDTKLMSMRMPDDIVRILPSVKKYKGSKDFVDLTDEVASTGGDTCASSKSESEVFESHTGETIHSIVGLAHRGRGTNKYVMKQVAEERFMGIIFDVGISPKGDIYVSCCEGVFQCDPSLERKMKLEQIIMPGGLGFFSDGRIVAICRNQDTLNFFSQDGVFIKAFRGGFSPMCMVINERDELIVSDPGHKCVHVFNTNGEEIAKIPTTNRDYSLRWPMYMALSQNDNMLGVKEEDVKPKFGNDLLVCDCHAQNLLRFDSAFMYAYTYKLKLSCGNEVLRPHGIATNQEKDIFIVDTTMDTVEVFSADDQYMQTLINSEDGSRIKPKCLTMNKKICVVGGRLGLVQVYEFLDQTEFGIKREQSSERTRSKSRDSADFKTPLKTDSKTPLKCENMENPSPSSSMKKRDCDAPNETPSKRASLRAARRNVFKPETIVKQEEDDDVAIVSPPPEKDSDVIVLE